MSTPPISANKKLAQLDLSKKINGKLELPKLYGPDAKEVIKATNALRIISERLEKLYTKEQGTAFSYTDESGKILFKKILSKYKNNSYVDAEGNKFLITKKEQLVLYNLPNVTKSNEILITEGEKIADLLNNIGFVATTLPGLLVLEKWQESFSKILKNKDVLFLVSGNSQNKIEINKIACQLESKTINLYIDTDKKIEYELENWYRKNRDNSNATTLLKKRITDLIKKQGVSHIRYNETINDIDLENESRLQRTKNVVESSIHEKVQSYFPSNIFNSMDDNGKVINVSQHLFSSDAHLRSPEVKNGHSQSKSANIVSDENLTEFNDIASEMYQRKEGSEDPLNISSVSESNIRYYDFSSYEFMLPPYHPYLQKEIDISNLQPAVNNLLRYFLNYMKNIIHDELFIHKNTNYIARLLWYETYEELCNRYYDYFLMYTAIELFNFYISINKENKEILCNYFREWFVDIITHSIHEDHLVVNSELTGYWKDGTKTILSNIATDYPEIAINNYIHLPDTYHFSPFPARTVNFGLQVLFRQTWKLSGFVPGPIVKTIPLGPKQTEKVSVKFVRHSTDKKSREFTIGKEIERESTENTKDSSDIVTEAARSSNWSFEASASYNGIFASASTKIGAGGERSNSSKQSKSHLNEVMEKTSNKMRSETKTIVSTEQDITYEEERSSEITNSNEELAVTYIYKQLLQQYETNTKMIEANSLVLVAEYVPEPSEITAEWIRQYDDILIKVLLDESLANDIALLRKDIEINETKIDNDLQTEENTSDLLTNMSSAMKSIDNFSASQGTYPDIFKTPQEMYINEIERRREVQRNKELQARRTERLRRHIIDNILHYCRAIWQSEDPDIRLQRYANIMVPVNWRYRSGNGTDNYYEMIIDDMSKDIMPLSDIISPTNPVGYYCNYAIYYLKNNAELVNLNEGLSHLRIPYKKYKIKTTIGAENKRNAVVSYVAVDNPLVHKLGILYSAQKLRITIETTLPGVINVISKDFNTNSLGKFIEVAGIRFILDSDNKLIPDTNDSWTIELSNTSELEDPELKQFRWETPIPSREEEGDVYTVEFVKDMKIYIEGFDNFFETTSDSEYNWSELSGDLKEYIRCHYHDYLFNKKYTKRFQIDTNNLLIDMITGKTSALEEFKRLHRYVDVMKANVEKEKMEVEKEELILENERRQKLLEANKLCDPDIDKVTVIGTEKELHSLINVDMDGGNGHDD